jgi:coenzyme F420-reducing hydrogenase delta subunit
MGVGPPGRTGRDQIVQANQFLAAATRRAGEVVVICCDQGAGRFAPALRREGAVVYPVSCAGNLHTSVIELLIRGGSRGVLVLACQPRDCWNREGPRWLIERVYHEREAELQPRVPRERVRVAHASAGDVRAALAELGDFSAAVSHLEAPATERNPEPEMVCDPAEPAVRT